MAAPIKLGIIGSSGGSALAAAALCLAQAGQHIAWTIVTDRACGISKWAEENGHTATQFEYLDPNHFSEKARSFFDGAGCDSVLLFYTRRVTSPLIDSKRVWNIHPALLPAFKGLHGVRDALAAGVKVLGATLHLVDAGLDTGPIVAQVAAPVYEGMTEPEAQRLSYLQKVWLTLIWFEHVTNSEPRRGVVRSGPAVETGWPGLVDEYLRASYAHFLTSLGYREFGIR
jgi:phosphoribosylglycinamide formyltransferase-1